MNKEALNILGISQKAGKVSSGEASIFGRPNKHISLLIIAENASDGTKKKYEKLMMLKNINYVISGTKEELGNAIGQSERSLVVIHDKKLSELFLSKLNIRSDNI